MVTFTVCMYVHKLTNILAKMPKYTGAVLLIRTHFWDVNQYKHSSHIIASPI